MTVEFDRATALRGLRLLRVAASRWEAVYEQLAGEQISDDQHREDLSTLLLGHAVEFLMWARGLDDYCKGEGARVGLPGYRKAREQELGLLEGARYVTNHALHQLADLTRLIGAFAFPLSFPFGFDKLAGVKWVSAAHLPPSEEERDEAQLRYRQRYEKYLAGQDIRSTMDRLLGWFADVLATH